MKTHRLAVTLTIINLGILLVVVLMLTSASRSEVAPVVRGRAFELVDENGKVRAEIKIMPAEPSTKMPDGSIGYPESVLFRLFDSEGGPNVKISATEDGSGVVLGGESGYIQILSRTTDPSIKLVSKNGDEQVIRIK
ncbi:hypothetical protein EG832_09650 [bacterium]|nr:hypothetical protein [bacterium]